MALPARQRRRPPQVPPVDPTAIDRAYRFYRAQRHARIEHQRRTRMARARFWAVVALLVLACLVVGVTIWNEISRLFGL